MRSFDKGLVGVLALILASKVASILLSECP